jgi:hypothetical protein
VNFGADIKLDDLAASFGRLKSNVCRKAKELGLTDIARPLKAPEDRRIRVAKFDSAEARSVDASRRAKAHIAEHGHPRGALGMKHTDEAKQKVGAASAKRQAGLSDEDRAGITKKMMTTRIANGNYAPPRPKTSWKAGWREIGGVKKYYRSKWEANYAYYLEWLKSKGEIAAWAHEPKTFWFDGIKRGTMTYLPDFMVTENGGAEAYHEVKGWMDDRSKTKIKRMAKYHPTVRLIVIDSKTYHAIRKAVQSIVPGWEL